MKNHVIRDLSPQEVAGEHWDTTADWSSEAGMSTAEYALGTVSATAFAGLLLWVVKQDWVKEGIESIFRNIFAY
ncbi:MAG: DUF4244 domain-containing protein [Ancrocorticia sp.]|jgi:hypothetical protein|nr:DUF4244 domain-containing protein [Ancrocorticia sp.]MCI1896050.1 DUF4244 domain-containing protein [Ancrocorticia sp.]MCI1932700.1 DUF4244 domain-containing protein [Ancrocorticia sp.]MCI1963788.1 DUF4244 domain-containing protein [Ancrocorticia sp.]MCI2002126.1 DUF4244 domain-containing protein [Ancrocorticia sp.]